VVHHRVRARRVALSTALVNDQAGSLTPTEKLMLREWLQRLS
jgi:hypothetical protein